jgi:hypothetical protein
VQPLVEDTTGRVEGLQKQVCPSSMNIQSCRIFAQVMFQSRKNHLSLKKLCTSPDLEQNFDYMFIKMPFMIIIYFHNWYCLL